MQLIGTLLPLGLKQGEIISVTGHTAFALEQMSG